MSPPSLVWYWPRMRARPRASRGWPFRSPQGALSRPCRAVRTSSVLMARAPLKMACRSPRSRTPRLTARPVLALARARQAARARAGQSRPAASPIATRGSHTSAGRSVIPSGRVGQVSLSWSPWLVAQSCSCAPSLRRASGALAVGLDLLAWSAAAHPDHHGAGQDGVGQVAQPGYGQRGVGGEGGHGLLDADADAAVGDTGAAVPGVEQPA